MYTLISIYTGEREKNISVGGRERNCRNDVVQRIPGMMSLNKQEEMGFMQKWRDWLRIAIRLKPIAYSLKQFLFRITPINIMA